MPVRRPKKSPPRTDLLLPKGYLSPSAVELYLTCPQAFYLQYVEKKDSLTAPPLVEGGVLHSVLEASNHHQVDHGDPLPEQEMVERWDDGFSAEKGKIADWGEEKEDVIRERSRVFISRYRAHYAKGITPAGHDAIEKKVEGEIGGVPVVGYVDVISNFFRDTPDIVDYKTGKSAKTEGEAESSIQMGVYAHLTGYMSVKYVSFVKTKEPKIQAVRAIRTERSLQRTANVVRGVAEAVTKGAFPFTDPGSWKCSIRYCGVWYACKQGGKR